MIAITTSKLLDLALSWNHGGSDGLSPSDAALVAEVQALMPEAPPAVDTALLTNSGSLCHLWQPSNGFGPYEPAMVCAEVRRAADTVLEELQHYFDGHVQAKIPNARTVLGGLLVCWAKDARQHEPTLESVTWWCDFLCRVEDAKTFTRSNWACASKFEEALSKSRLSLVRLRKRLQTERKGDPSKSLHHLSDILRKVLRIGREAADSLLELLYIALRGGPRMAKRVCFSEILREMELGREQAVEDQIVFRMLKFEEQQALDQLASVLMTSAAPATTISIADAVDAESRSLVEIKHGREVCSEIHQVRDLFLTLEGALTRCDGQSPCSIPPDHAKAIGPRGRRAFLELHGLYCLLAALVQRLELSVYVLEEYARFACFLPSHRATVLDLEILLPRMQDRIAFAVDTLSSAYESLPRSVAPPGRSNIVEMGRVVTARLDLCVAKSLEAVIVLKACTPISTVQDFQTWKNIGCPVQIERLQLAAKSLLATHELEEHGVLGLAENALEIERAAERSTMCCADQDDDNSNENFNPGDQNVKSFGIGLLSVDEDTRLYEMGRHLGRVSSTVCEGVLSVGSNATEAAGSQLLLLNKNLPHGVARVAAISVQAASLLTKSMSSDTEQSNIKPPHFKEHAELDWVVVSTDESSKLNTSSTVSSSDA